MSGWWGMACFNGLSPDQQHDVLVRGVLEFRAVPAGDCPNGAEVAVETMWDPTPGPRFMCLACAVAYVAALPDSTRVAEPATLSLSDREERNP
jgi:hypothetical protein